MSFLKQIIKFPKSILPAKKQALFVVFAVVLVMGELFVFSNFANAAFKMTDAQKQEFIQIIKNDPDISNSLKTDALINSYISRYEGGYSNFEEARKAYQDTIGNYVSSADVLTGITAVDKEVGLKSAARGLLYFGQEAVLGAIIGVLAVIVNFLKDLVLYAAEALDLALNPSLYYFTNSEMVNQGWIIVRDVCNLFFLLVLLFIAICTILKIEKYHAKKTLLMLIIMALLINFSKPIAVFIFDGSQLLMNFFLSQMGEAGTGNTTSTVVAQSSTIANLVYKSLPDYFGSSQTSMNIAVQYLFAVIFLFMLGVAYVVTALMLIIRIVAIMLIIIVAPLAFFAAIIPDFSNLGSKWWKALFEYSYYGPAAAFFLLLATKLERALPNLATGINSSNVNNITITVQNIIHYLVTLVFLYASILMAKQFGGGVGAAVVGNANRFMKWAGEMSKGGGMWGSLARGTGQVTGATDRYKGIKKGISQTPGWRMLTKEGREAKSKETQERWAGKIAPFNIANAKKKAKDRENDSEEKILQDAENGDAAALLVASQRGYSKDRKGGDLWTNSNVVRALDNNDLRKAAYGNLRDKGKTHHVIDAEIQRTNISSDANAVRELYDNELGNLSANNLGKQDLEALASNMQATNPVTGDQWILNKIKQLHEADPRLITNMLASGNTKNIQFIRDQRRMGNIPLGNNTAGNTP